MAVGASDGSVAAFDATSGREQWRGNAGAPLAAGVGFDGSTAAVVTRNNDLVAFVGGKEVWRQKLGALSYTPPLVAGARVFVLGGDRSVTAFDGGTGRRLWGQQRTGEPLVLRQSGVLMAVGDTLVVGQGGRLVGMNPLNGTSRWEAPIATARGINDVERLVDLVGRVSRVGDVVCARAFQAAVGCVDAGRGQRAVDPAGRAAAKAWPATPPACSAPSPMAGSCPGSATPASAPGPPTACCIAASARPWRWDAR